MRNILFVFFTAAVITATVFIDPFENTDAKNSEGKYTLVIHGGAGTFNRNFPDSVKEQYLISLKEALNIGKKILENNGSSLDAVEQVIRYMEDNPLFNAGRGAVIAANGKHELDASIMDGSNLSNGAVTIVTNVKNPVSLARLVMEKTDHVLLGGPGAEEFAFRMNVKLVDNNYFTTPYRYEQWKKAGEKNSEDIKGTVGAVALDKNGNLAAATSTGGRSYKLPGRIGDSPLINAGTYANNKTCAVSGTGIGEKFITHTVAYQVSALMEFKNLTLKNAAEEVINNILEKGEGGIIAVDKDGNYCFPYNTEGMLRGVVNSSGTFEVKIWE